MVKSTVRHNCVSVASELNSDVSVTHHLPRAPLNQRYHQLLYFQGKTGLFIYPANEFMLIIITSITSNVAH